MSGGAAAATEAEAGAEAGEAGGRKGKGRLIVLIAVPLVLVAAGAGLWFSGVLPGLLGMGQKAEEVAAEPQIVPALFDMPEIIVNLNVGNRRASYLKLRAKIEIADSRDLPHLQAAVPRLQDLFTTYLRELRPEELRGSAGTHRLREELIARANIVARPARVTDVLFVEMLVQ